MNKFVSGCLNFRFNIRGRCKWRFRQSLECLWNIPVQTNLTSVNSLGVWPCIQVLKNLPAHSLNNHLLKFFMSEMFLLEPATWLLWINFILTVFETLKLQLVRRMCFLLHLSHGDIWWDYRGMWPLQLSPVTTTILAKRAIVIPAVEWGLDAAYRPPKPLLCICSSITSLHVYVYIGPELTR